jgi:nicotinamidase-related amidase
VDSTQLIQKSEPFLRYLADWVSSLPHVKLADLAPARRRIAIISVDVINGFCYSGPLASPRIQQIIAPIVDLMERAHAMGVTNIALVQEAHEEDAVEFNQYPPHAIRNTHEAEAVPEIQALPFFPDMSKIGKNSIHPALNTRLEQWLQARPEVDTFIAVGDCTDLCTYQLAMHLRLRANARQLKQRIVVPENCTQTFDISLDQASRIGAIPHDGDLLHLTFLYSMHLNGVEVVRSIS